MAPQGTRSEVVAPCDSSGGPNRSSSGRSDGPERGRQRRGRLGGDAAAWSELIDNASVRLLDPTGVEWIDGNVARLAKTPGDGAGVFDNADRGAAAAASRRRRLFEIGRAPVIL